MTAYVQDLPSVENTGTLPDLHIGQDTEKRAARALSSLSAAFLPVMVYFREDLCRTIFILSIAIVTVSGAFYHLGWMNKTNMQQYLILKETQEAKMRMHEALMRNIAGLEALGRTPWVQETTHSEALAHLSNINVYFSANGNTALSTFFREKIEELITYLQRGGGRNISGSTGVLDWKGMDHVYLNTMTALKAFAVKEKEAVVANERNLASDARKELVGAVGRFNFMMDYAASVGLIFLVTTVACIPGLGRDTKTGFV